MLLINLPLVLSTALFSLSASDGRAAAAAPAHAEVDRGARSERGHGHADLCAALACTDAQRTAITKAITDMRSKLKAAGGHGDRNAALAKAMADGKVTRAEVLAALRSDEAARAKRDGIIADAIVAIHGALGSAQRKQLAGLVEARGAKALIGGGHHGDKAGKPSKAGKPGKAGPQRKAARPSHRKSA
jgi:Spy/CpxP family protein refolding chaperone